MRHAWKNSFALRLSLLTLLVIVIAFVLPLVALAGGGDPSGI